MYKTKISATYKSKLPFDEIIAIIRNELNVKVGNANISPRGRISVDDLTIKQKIQNAYVSAILMEGFVNQNNDDFVIEISVKTRGGKMVLIAFIMLIVLLIGLALVPIYFIIVYFYHRRTCSLVRKSLENIRYDLK
jgi:hypothetical protein